MKDHGLDLAVIGNGLILLQVSPFYEQIIKGTILVLAIILLAVKAVELALGH